MFPRLVLWWSSPPISWDDLSLLTIEQFRYGWSVEVVTTSGQCDSEDVWLGNS